MPEPDENAIELDDEGKPLAGVKAKQAAVEYLKSVLEQVLDFFPEIVVLIRGPEGLQETSDVAHLPHPRRTKGALVGCEARSEHRSSKRSNSRSYQF